MSRLENFAWLLLLGPVFLTGCTGMAKAKVSADATAGYYKKVNLSYRADSEHVKACCAAPPSEGKLVSYQEPSVPLPDDTISTLDIRFPHPERTPGMAFVQVTIESRSQTESPAHPSKSTFQRFWNKTRDELPGLKGTGWTHEVWVIDIPKSELDHMLSELRVDGFFTSDKAPSSTTVLSMTVDGVKTHKHWRQVRQLDTLISRVRTDGRLTTSTFPSKQSKRPREPGDKVAGWKRYTTLQAYRDLLARDAARGGSSNKAADADRVVRLPDTETAVR